MSANTACTILIQSGLTAAEQAGSFNISYCLPIYDNRTDGDVMASPLENANSETSSETDPDDFHGVAFPKLSSGKKYVLKEWGADGSNDIIAYTGDKGWANLPPYSQENTESEDAVGVLSIDAVITDASLSGTTISGTAGTSDAISSWDPDDLYKTVVYLGSKENDGGWKSSYGIYLTCREPSVDTEVSVIPGAIRFNKVLLFQGEGSPVPVAIVCLPSPVAIGANVAGVANSITSNFSFGYDASLTPQAASFDNTFWSKLSDESETIPPVYTPSKVVVGGSGAESVEADNSAITIYEEYSQALPYSIIAKNSAGNTLRLSARDGLVIDSSSVIDTVVSSLFIRNTPTNVYVGNSIGLSVNMSDININGSFVDAVTCVGTTDLDVVKSITYSLFIDGYDAQVSKVRRSICVGEYTSASTSWKQAVNLDHAVLVGDDNGVAKLSSSLLVGNSNYHNVPSGGSSNYYKKQDVLCNSLIIGDDNEIGRSAVDDTSSTLSPKPIVILGHDNVTKSVTSYLNNSNGKYSVYIFGSDNTIEATKENEIGAEVEDVPRFVFGNGAKIKGWKWTHSPTGTTYGDTEYNHVFDFVIPQYGTFTPTGGAASVNYFSGDDACGISVGFKPTESGGMISTTQTLIIDTHFKAVESNVSVTGGTATKYGMRLPSTLENNLGKNGVIYCLDPELDAPSILSEADFVQVLWERFQAGYAPLFVKMPTAY